MKLQFLHTSRPASRLILICAGWSTTPDFYSHISMPGWDTAVVWGDCRPLPTSELQQLRAYPTVHLYAWSLGVFNAQVLINSGLSPIASYAINGTCLPVHDTLGIPQAIFQGTRTTLSPQNLQKFRSRMLGSPRLTPSLFPTPASEAEVEELQAQLYSYEQATETAVKAPAENGIETPAETADRGLWTKAYISTSDRIFPPQNLQRFWATRAAETELLTDAPHYVDLMQIVKQTIVDIDLTHRRFARSIDTYTSNAIAQRTIANNLYQKISDLLPAAYSPLSIMEVGHGSGILSYQLANLHPASALFIDLCKCGPFNIAAKEEYRQGDAETILEELAADTSQLQFSLIASTSTMQWFTNPARFLSNCARLLRPDGLLAITSFTVGNMAQLDSFRTSMLRYLTKEQIEEMLSEKFQILELSTESIDLEFSSPALILRHLKLTGVTGSAATSLSPAQIRRLLSSYPALPNGNYALTFTPIYILARPKQTF